VRTGHLPSDTAVCEATTTMNYIRFRLNGSDFLLPSETRLHIDEMSGVEMENRTVYSGCYEFLGESTLKFETPPDVPIQKASAPCVQTALSAGLRFSLALAEDIHVATAAAGDVVKAVLTTDLRDRANKVVVRKHTPVLCRIGRIRRHYYCKQLGMPATLHRLELLAPAGELRAARR